MSDQRPLRAVALDLERGRIDATPDQLLADTQGPAAREVEIVQAAALAVEIGVALDGDP